MKYLPHTARGRVMAAATAGVAGTVLFAGVASAAGSSGSTPPPSGSVTTPSTTTPGTGKVAHALKEIRQELRGGTVSGSVTVQTKKGTKTVEFERGVVSDVTSSSFEVTDSTGVSQTWAIGPKTKVRERGERKNPTASAPTITNGENVVVLGVDTGGTTTARVVVVVPAHTGHSKRGATTPGTSTPDTTGTSNSALNT